MAHRGCREARRDWASRCCRCSTRMRDSAARRRRPGSGASCIRRTRLRTCIDRLRERAAEHGYVLGVAPHSLRAVTAEELGQIVRLAPELRRRSTSMPPSRRARSTSAYAATRMRPVEWLLTQARADARWCIVHATHMTEREIDGAGGERRGRGARADDRGRSRRRHVSRRSRTSRPTDASASAAIRTP